MSGLRMGRLRPPVDLAAYGGAAKWRNFFDLGSREIQFAAIRRVLRRGNEAGGSVIGQVWAPGGWHVIC